MHLGKLSLGEVLEFAVSVERNGFAMYRQFAVTFAGTELEKLFDELADEEVKHEEDFKRMFGDVKAENLPETYFDEYREYMESIINLHLFQGKKVEEVAAKITDANEALKFALEFEKDSLLFFLELKNLVDDKDKAMFDKLINEERGHVLKLSKKLIS